jgi:SagB-type dehydrogenase family enzyme
MRWLWWLTVAALVASCGADAAERNDEGSEVMAHTTIELPMPAIAGSSFLEETIAARRSIRDYSARALGPEELSQLLWAAQGVTSGAGKRAAPSAGALYPLEMYVATSEGVFHYRPDGHVLLQVDDRDRRDALAEAALDQDAVAEGAAVFAITAVYSRTEQKYGSRAVRYATLEAGHAAQNLLLQATALGLGAVPIGAFADDEVKAVLGLPDDHAPLYLIPVGEPASD